MNIIVILGTPRQGRLSEPAAHLIMEKLSRHGDIAAELIDIRALSIPVDDAGRQIQIHGFAEEIEAADAMIIVSPEYNHGYPGLLKHVLDTRLREYRHKAVGIVGISKGSFGGARMIENLLPVLRALGLVVISRDVNIGNVREAFDESGHLVNPAYEQRIDKFITELIWMAKALRYAREHFEID